MGMRVSFALFALCLLTGCSAEETIDVEETVAGEETPAEKPVAEKPISEEPKPAPEKKKEKKPTVAETLGLTEKEAEAMALVLSAGPDDYKLEEVAEILVRNEDADFVNYKVTLHDGTVLLPSIRKDLLGK